MEALALVLVGVGQADAALQWQLGRTDVGGQLNLGMASGSPSLCW
jgi:hypothetical protein